MANSIRFYADVHVPLSVTQGLRARGVDVLTAQDRGAEEVEDSEHLAFATTDSRVMLTQDSDFLALDHQGVQHTGIVYTRQGTPIGEMVKGLMLIYEVLDSEDMINHIEFL